MDRKGELISKAVEIAVGVIVGYAAYRVSATRTESAGLYSIMIGLLSTLVVAHLLESYRHSQEMRRISLDQGELLQKIGEKHQEASDFAQVLRYGVALFPSDRYFDVLLQLLWRVESGVLAANYVDPEEGWGRAYGELYTEIQRTKIKVNKANIRRVFIVDSEEELRRLHSIMSKQKQAGIKVKYIRKARIEATSVLKAGADRLETLDFDVIDSKYVWLTVLDKGRKIKHGKILFGKEDCDRYKRFYDYLFEEAEEVEC